MKSIKKERNKQEELPFYQLVHDRNVTLLPFNWGPVGNNKRGEQAKDLQKLLHKR
jgi:hypothetical protein